MVDSDSRATSPLSYLEKTGGFNHLDEIRQTELLRLVLSQGISLRMTAYGASMLPFIRDGDKVTISPLTEKAMQVGEIVAFERPGTNQLVIHRVIRKTNLGYEMKGDHSSVSDGEIPPQNILGKIIKIEHEDKSANFGIGEAGKWIALLSKGHILPKFYIFFPLLKIIYPDL